MPADDYALFATDYHWFFDDVALRLGSDVPGVRAALSRLPAGSRVLDAACGIAIDAAWLERQGHAVAAADASGPMVAVARDRLATTDGVADVDLVHCTWDQLAEHFELASFDLVLCAGSAIAHTHDADSMDAALGAFRSMLRPGGVLVADTHDWEVVFASGGARAVDPIVVERDGIRCVRTFSWQLPDRPGTPAIFEPAVILLDGDRATMRSYPIRLWPFTRAELRERLAGAGFERIGLDAMPGDDRYTALAHAPA
jgi:SAM-dependent methyltransferase